MIKKLLITTAMLSSLSCLAGEKSMDSIDWSYVGRTGPDHWSKLDEEYMKCNYGALQSPINLDTVNLLSDKEKIQFHYNECKNTDDFSKSKHIKIGGKIFKLIKFHFHMPSEHSVNHMRYPAELHLVHMDAEGKLAVVGIFITIGKENNKTVDALIDAASANNEKKFTVEDGDLMPLLPKDTNYFHYQGSLTTPPCSEGVQWYVLKTPIEVSEQEIKDLRKLIPDDNSRPIQDDKGRVAK